MISSMLNESFPVFLVEVEGAPLGFSFAEKVENKISRCKSFFKTVQACVDLTEKNFSGYKYKTPVVVSHVSQGTQK